LFFNFKQAADPADPLTKHACIKDLQLRYITYFMDLHSLNLEKPKELGVGRLEEIEDWPLTQNEDVRIYAYAIVLAKMIVSQED